MTPELVKLNANRKSILKELNAVNSIEHAVDKSTIITEWMSKDVTPKLDEYKHRLTRQYESINNAIEEERKKCKHEHTSHTEYDEEYECDDCGERIL